jgi:SCY1-like protein 1
VNDAKLKHNNLHTASVFVNEAGDWKLAGLEYVTAADQESPLKILPALEKYEPPERSKVNIYVATFKSGH